MLREPELHTSIYGDKINERNERAVRVKKTESGN
jgi:hypothetical protein